MPTISREPQLRPPSSKLPALASRHAAPDRVDDLDRWPSREPRRRQLAARHDLAVERDRDAAPRRARSRGAAPRRRPSRPSASSTPLAVQLDDHRPRLRSRRSAPGSAPPPARHSLAAQHRHDQPRRSAGRAGRRCGSGRCEKQALDASAPISGGVVGRAGRRPAARSTSSSSAISGSARYASGSSSSTPRRSPAGRSRAPRRSRRRRPPVGARHDVDPLADDDPLARPSPGGPQPQDLPLTGRTGSAASPAARARDPRAGARRSTTARRALHDRRRARLPRRRRAAEPRSRRSPPSIPDARRLAGRAQRRAGARGSTSASPGASNRRRRRCEARLEPPALAPRSHPRLEPERACSSWRRRSSAPRRGRARHAARRSAGRGPGRRPSVELGGEARPGLGRGERGGEQLLLAPARLADRRDHAGGDVGRRVGRAGVEDDDAGAGRAARQAQASPMTPAPARPGRRPAGALLILAVMPVRLLFRSVREAGRPSLRRHYPDQVRTVGGASRPLSRSLRLPLTMILAPVRAAPRRPDLRLLPVPRDASSSPTRASTSSATRLPRRRARRLLEARSRRRRPDPASRQGRRRRAAASPPLGPSARPPIATGRCSSSTIAPSSSAHAPPTASTSARTTSGGRGPPARRARRDRRALHPLPGPARRRPRGDGGARPDYLSVGPVWETPTKPGRPAAGLDLRAPRRRPRRAPLVRDRRNRRRNIAEVVAAGAGRAVVVRAIRDAADPPRRHGSCGARSPSPPDGAPREQPRAQAGGPAQAQAAAARPRRRR